MFNKYLLHLALWKTLLSMKVEKPYYTKNVWIRGSFPDLKDIVKTQKIFRKNIDETSSNEGDTEIVLYFNLSYSLS